MLDRITITKHTKQGEVITLADDCKMCGKCCQFGSGYLAPQDYEKLAKVLGISIEELKKDFLEEQKAYNTTVHKPRLIRNKGKPYGRCVFHNDNEGCSVHGAKPLQCKVTSPCADAGVELNQWFLLNYVVNPADPESIRQWALFLKFNKVIPGGELHDLVKDPKKLKKILSYEILK